MPGNSFTKAPAEEFTGVFRGAVPSLGGVAKARAALTFMRGSGERTPVTPAARLAPTT
ncbi:hypothetical protein ACFWMR_02470 [Amycolatopsis thailandensis]|uniref:hypothetical protein n=1 Tax=Amycolatopsis thailandensis TaxID=589330 RepID=UPI00365E12D6